MKRYLITYQMEDQSPDTMFVLVERHQTPEAMLRKHLKRDLEHQGLGGADIKEVIDSLQILEMKKV